MRHDQEFTMITIALFIVSYETLTVTYTINLKIHLNSKRAVVYY